MENSFSSKLVVPKDQLFWAGTLTILFIAAYWIPLKGIVTTWATNDDYSYGFLIPIMSAYLFWDMRERISGTIFKPAWAVLPFLIMFIILSIYGILGSSGNISRPAIPIVFMLMFAFTFGLQAFKRFALPLGFLIFMVPLPALLDRTFGVFLKSVSSLLGGMIIRAAGLSVHVSGNVIDLGVTQLQVVDACSGLRFVFPLLALGVIYAYFFEKVRWKQIFLVLSTVPIAILTNGLRIGITGILTHYYGPEMAEGFFHDFSGWAIFMVAFVFLFLLGRLLRWFPPKPPQTPPSEAAENKDSPVQQPGTGQTAFIVSLILILCVGALSLATGALPSVTLKNGINAFPKTFQGWNGSVQEIDAEMIEESGAEEAFSAAYINHSNIPVSLYIGYRSSAFLENENYFHSPTVCLPSSGWKVIGTSTHTIQNIPRFGELKVSTMLIEQMGMRQLVYFWFQTKKWATHDKNLNRFHLTLHALKRDNTHVMFIRTITPVLPDESLQDTETRLDGFVRDVLETTEGFLAEQLNDLVSKQTSEQ